MNLRIKFLDKKNWFILAINPPINVAKYPRKRPFILKLSITKGMLGIGDVLTIAINKVNKKVLNNFDMDYKIIFNLKLAN